MEGEGTRNIRGALVLLGVVPFLLERCHPTAPPAMERGSDLCTPASAGWGLTNASFAHVANKRLSGIVSEDKPVLCPPSPQRRLRAGELTQFMNVSDRRSDIQG